MNKRERLERTIAGESVDRLPVMLWRYFPGDDQRIADLAAATLAFQQTWDFDVVKITPSENYALLEYGLQDKWEGALDGKREISKTIIDHPLHWTELRRIEPTRGLLGAQGNLIRVLQDALGEETPLVHSVLSPLDQAKRLAGQETLLRHVRQEPDRLKTGLGIITENTLRFLDSLRKSGIAGIFYSVEQATFNLMSPSEYNEFGRAYDLQILNALPPNWWLNILNLNCEFPMFDFFVQYPVQVLNWRGDLADGKVKFMGAVCGGIQRNTMLYQAPGVVRDEARRAIEQTNGRRLILSTESALYIPTPYSNIRTVQQVVG